MNEFDNIPTKGLDNLPESPVPSHLDTVKVPKKPGIEINVWSNLWYYLTKVFSKASELTSKGYEVIKSIQDIKTAGYLAVGVLILIIIVIILVKVL